MITSQHNVKGKQKVNDDQEMDFTILTEYSLVAWWTVTSVAIGQVNTSCSILT